MELVGPVNGRVSPPPCVPRTSSALVRSCSGKAELVSAFKCPVPKDAADARDNEIKENTNQGSPSPMFQEKETSPNDKRFGATATADTVGD